MADRISFAQPTRRVRCDGDVIEVPSIDAAAMVAGGAAEYVDESTPLTVPAPSVRQCTICGAVLINVASLFCARHRHLEG